MRIERASERHLSRIFLAGKTAAARLALEQRRDEGVRYSGLGSSATAVCSLPLSEIVYENNEIDLAAQLIEEAMPSALEFGFVDQLQSAFTMRARTCHARGDTDAAFQALDQGMSLAMARDLQRLTLALTAERVRILMERGRPDEAVRYAEGPGHCRERPDASALRYRHYA